MTIPIRRAQVADAAHVAEVIAIAFHPLAVARWLVPDQQRRAQILQRNFRIWVDHALDHGEIHLTGDAAGVAVWFPRDREIPAPVDYEKRLETACEEATARFRELDALFEMHHPKQPHHHLAFLAVQPDRQGRGIGTALLRHHHLRLDTEGLAAYLEASSPPARDLYRAWGYERWSESFRLPDQTPMWPMWRPPGGTHGIAGRG